MLFYTARVLVRGQYGIRVQVKNQTGGILRAVALRVESQGPRYLAELGDPVRASSFCRRCGNRTQRNCGWLSGAVIVERRNRGADRQQGTGEGKRRHSFLQRELA